MSPAIVTSHQNGPSKGLDNELRVLFWNAGGLNISKHAELKTNVYKIDADIIIIVEAGASTDATCFYGLTDYTLFVIKRSRQVASGIIAFVRTSIASKSTTIHEMSNHDKLEAIAIDAWKNSVHYKVIGLYNPPNNIPNLDHIANLCQHKSTIVIGDFNAHSTRWAYSTTNATGRVVEDFLDHTPLIRIPSDPTFLSFAGRLTTPDLVMVHGSMSSRATASLADPMDGCGHRLIYLRVRNKTKIPIVKKFTRWNFKKAKWDKYSHLSDLYITDELVGANPDVSAKLVTEGMLRAASDSIPKGQVKKYSPYWSDALDEVKKERNTARNKAENTKNISDCISLRKAQAKLKRAIIVAKRYTYRSFVAKLDFRRDGLKAHKFISRLNNDKTDRHWEPVNVNGRQLTHPRDVAIALCKNYANISKLHINANERRAVAELRTSTCQTEEHYHLFTKDFSPDELSRAISTIKKSKSAGPDGVFPDFVKYLGPKARLTFLRLINTTWKIGVPNQWRKAEVISLLKKGKPANDLNSYRPISLTSVCCKVAEKMVECRLREFLESKGAISDCQAGFRKHRSTIDQVVKFTQAVKDGFHRKQSTVAVLVDFKAAYDKVWRGMLLSKLRKQGVSGNMINWIKSFLTQRSIRCKFFDAISPYKLLRQGLPQGAVLSCLLFTIMIDDLRSAIEETSGASCLFFADDVIIWATGSKITAAVEALNKVMMSIEKWANLNKMEVNVEKTVCQLFTMSTRPPPIDVKYRGVPLRQVPISKYLGINLDNKLSWNAHIAETANKGHKRNNLLRRLTATKWGATQEVLTTAYKTYVRPVLEYGSEVVSLASKTSLTKYDVVQNNAMRVITGGAKSTPIAAMQIQTGIEPLECRRDKYILNFWERSKRVDHKYWHGYMNASQRLKTQTSPRTQAQALADKYQLSIEQPAPLRYYNTVVSALPTRRLDLINFATKKTEASPLELKAHALETINVRYPPAEWLHVYTDGSYIPETRAAGAGWYCHLFENSIAVGRNATNYDGEVRAVYEASNQLLASNLHPARVVFLIDSQAAILMLSSNAPTDCEETTRCRGKLDQLISAGWVASLQWVPSHVGVHGNEKADANAKEGAGMDQPNVPLTLNRAKNQIRAAIGNTMKNTLKTLSTGKKWENLATVGPICRNLERAEAVARFRLNTGHDYLQAHLHRIGLAANDTCPLCHGGRMDEDHLRDCAALTYPNDDLVNRYWEARRRMVEQPRSGVG